LLHASSTVAGVVSASAPGRTLTLAPLGFELIRISSVVPEAIVAQPSPRAPAQTTLATPTR